MKKAICEIGLIVLLATLLGAWLYFHPRQNEIDLGFGKLVILK